MDEKKVIFLSSLKKIDALEEMVKALRERGLLSRSEGVFEDLKKREEVGSTGIGRSIALPHSQGEGIEKPLIALGVSRKGVDYDSGDGLPVHLLFLVLSPMKPAGRHLELLAAAARLAKTLSGRLAPYLESGDPERFFEVLRQEASRF